MGLTVKFIDMRNELVGYLEGLANPSYQQACWVDGNCPKGIEHDEFDYVVHFLFDDTTLSSDAEKWVGLCLRNNQEAAAIKNICIKIDTIFQKYGYELTDAEYITLPEWQTVVDTTISALEYFK
ncbi:MAG: hypothetical protein KAJ40_03225 [Alphaproteobacteria bacterium]|nr:hypothetical protein [Alphaproteobacteria bacterium]